MHSHLAPDDALAPQATGSLRAVPEPLTAVEAEELVRDLLDLTRSLFALVLPAELADPIEPASAPSAPRPSPPASLPMPTSIPATNPTTVPMPASVPASMTPPAAPEPVLPTVARGPEPIPLPAEPVRPERVREERTMSLLDEIGFLDD